MWWLLNHDENKGAEEFRKLQEEKKQRREETFKRLLKRIGFVLAGVSAVVYLSIVYILIKGFETAIDSDKLLLFLIIGAVAGLSITVSLRIQGIDLAKETKKAVDVMERYTALISKEETIKVRSINYHFWVSLIKDILIKGVTIVVSLYFAIEIIITGMQDEKYFLLAFANIFMFLGFGLMALARAFDYYMENHIPYLERKIQLHEEVNKSVKEYIREIDTPVEDGIESGNDKVSNGIGEGIDTEGIRTWDIQTKSSRIRG